MHYYGKVEINKGKHVQKANLSESNKFATENSSKLCYTNPSTIWSEWLKFVNVLILRDLTHCADPTLGHIKLK